MIRRYEHMLDIAPESLVTLCDALNRVEPARAVARTRAAIDEDRLFQLLRAAETGAALTGLEWAELAEIVRATPGLLVYPEIWTRIAGRLLEELVVADRKEWLLRQEAMSRLLEHPQAARYAVERCIALVGDPSSPAVFEPMALLEVTTLPGRRIRHRPAR